MNRAVALELSCSPAWPCRLEEFRVGWSHKLCGLSERRGVVQGRRWLIASIATQRIELRPFQPPLEVPNCPGPPGPENRETGRRLTGAAAAHGRQRTKMHSDRILAKPNVEICARHISRHSTCNSDGQWIYRYGYARTEAVLLPEGAAGCSCAL